MTFGVSAAGGNPKNGRRKADHYSTPEDASHAGMDIPGLENMEGLWECACGDGRLAKIITARRPDLKIIASDLLDYGYGEVEDFLDCDWPVNLNKDKSAIFTNPPFSLSEEFIRRSLYHNPAMIVMFSKSTYYHADIRRQFFGAMRPRYKYDLTFRVDFSGEGRPTMECSWFVWLRDQEQICEVKLLPRSPHMLGRPKQQPPEDDWDIL